MATKDKRDSSLDYADEDMNPDTQLFRTTDEVEEKFIGDENTGEFIDLSWVNPEALVEQANKELEVTDDSDRSNQERSELLESTV